MFGLGIMLKEIFLADSAQFVFSTTRLVPGNVIMVAIDMCGKGPITGEWIYGITWKHVYFNIFVLFIVDTISILKLAFPTVHCFCLLWLLWWLSCCHYCYCCCCIYLSSYLFIYLFIYLVTYFLITFSAGSTVILSFVVVVAITFVAFVLGVIVSFCVCWVIVAINLMLMFSILVLLLVLYFTVNSVDK